MKTLIYILHLLITNRRCITVDNKTTFVINNVMCNLSSKVAVRLTSNI